MPALGAALGIGGGISARFRYLAALEAKKRRAAQGGKLGPTKPIGNPAIFNYFAALQKQRQADALRAIARQNIVSKGKGIAAGVGAGLALGLKPPKKLPTPTPIKVP